MPEVNELLCFLQNKYHNHPQFVVKKAIIDFCRENEILTAKQTLIQYVTDKSLIQQYVKRPIGDNKNKSILDDIVSIWSVVDEHNLMNKLPIFCAADLSRIPVLSDELSDLAFIRKTVVDLEAQMHTLTDSMNNVMNNQSNVGTVNPAQALLTCTDSGTGETTHSPHRQQNHESSPPHDHVENYADAAKRVARRAADDEGYQTVSNKKK